MEIYYNKLLGSISMALDAVETELLGTTTNHGRRIALLSMAMGKHLHLEKGEFEALASYALLHDNAIAEFIKAELSENGSTENFKRHCVIGEKNVHSLPLKQHFDHFVLYHHERADGRGPFGKKEGEIPLGAAIIAAADIIDSEFRRNLLTSRNLPVLRRQIEDGIHVQFTKEAGEALLAVMDTRMLERLQDDAVQQAFDEAMPAWVLDMGDTGAIQLAGLIARIIDYKSHFTWKHSVQIANRAWWMGGYYEYSNEKRTQVYLAAALHDIGKLKTPLSVLEKRGSLDPKEYEIIKKHGWWTYEKLKDVPGLEEICQWASNHHEKLDGSGYPFGKTSGEMDFVSRLMACIDIYQAVSEERPYHPPRGHEDTMKVLYGMGHRGYIDLSIVEDLDREMAKLPNGDAPPPPGAL
ncbi:MAG: HD-GYP domain-containing protein [Oscillospiraceae bacterium]